MSVEARERRAHFPSDGIAIFKFLYFRHSSSY
jgi:hypothetical protein